MIQDPFTICAMVLAVVEDALRSCGIEVGSTNIATGAIIVDDCCPGLLTVAPERVFRTTDPFPTEAFDDGQCDGRPIAVDLVVRVDRCTPTIGDDGAPPSFDDQAASTREVLTDAAVIWNALASVLLLGDDGHGGTLLERANLNQIFTPPQGGCIGTETRVTLGVPADLWCPDCSDLED